MKEIFVQSFTDLIGALEHYKDSNTCIFRGQANSSWKLLPKSGRPEFSKKYSKRLSEQGLFESWKRYAKHFVSKEWWISKKKADKKLSRHFIIFIFKLYRSHIS